MVDLTGNTLIYFMPTCIYASPLDSPTIYCVKFGTQQIEEDPAWMEAQRLIPLLSGVSGCPFHLDHSLGARPQSARNKTVGETRKKPEGGYGKLFVIHNKMAVKRTYLLRPMSVTPITSVFRSSTSVFNNDYRLLYTLLSSAAFFELPSKPHASSLSQHHLHFGSLPQCRRAEVSTPQVRHPT